MTPEQHAQRIRQIAFQLEKADYGLGMPRDYQRVLELRVMLEDARKEFAKLRGIVLRQVLPPIPDRRFDWCAFYDGHEEENHSGYGATAEEALADLDRLDQERAEALEDAEHMDSDYAEQQEGY